MLVADDVSEGESLELLGQSDVEMWSEVIMNFLSPKKPRIEKISKLLLTSLKKFPKDLKLFVGQGLLAAITDNDTQNLKDRRNFWNTNLRTPQYFNESHADIFRDIDIDSIMSDICFFEDLETYFEMIRFNESIVSFLD